MTVVQLPRRRSGAARAMSPAAFPSRDTSYTAPRTLPFAPLDLDTLDPIASGSERRIYQHPHEPALLVKVVDESLRAADAKRRPLKHWHKRFQREGAYRNHIAEIAEYTAASSLWAGRWKVPLARILGLIQTSQGLGLLVEKISDGRGGLAPTVEQIVRERGLDAALTRQLDFFFDALADAHIVVNDFSPRNIVRGENSDGEAGLYLVDGFGSKQAIPLFALSKTLNRRRIQRHYRTLREKLIARSGKRQAQG